MAYTSERTAAQPPAHSFHNNANLHGTRIIIHQVLHTKSYAIKYTHIYMCRSSAFCHFNKVTMTHMIPLTTMRLCRKQRKLYIPTLYYSSQSTRSQRTNYTIRMCTPKIKTCRRSVTMPTMITNAILSRFQINIIYRDH